MGQPLGGNALLIAAQTVVLGYALVAGNEREFTRIAELPVENWDEVKQLPSPAVSRGARSEPGELVCVTVYTRGAMEVVRRLARDRRGERGSHGEVSRGCFAVAPRRAVTTDSLRYPLRDLAAANTFWQLRTERAAATHAWVRDAPGRKGA